MTFTPVIENAEIVWIGNLHTQDFRGWTVGQGNVQSISWHNDTRDFFIVHFVTGETAVIPNDNFAVQYKPLPNRHQKRAERTKK